MVNDGDRPPSAESARRGFLVAAMASLGGGALLSGPLATPAAATDTPAKREIVGRSDQDEDLHRQRVTEAGSAQVVQGSWRGFFYLYDTAAMQARYRPGDQIGPAIVLGTQDDRTVEATDFGNRRPCRMNHIAISTTQDVFSRVQVWLLPGSTDPLSSDGEAFTLAADDFASCQALPVGWTRYSNEAGEPPDRETLYQFVAILDALVAANLSDTDPKRGRLKAVLVATEEIEPGFDRADALFLAGMALAI